LIASAVTPAKINSKKSIPLYFSIYMKTYVFLLPLLGLVA